MTKPVAPINATPLQKRAGRRTTDPHVTGEGEDAAPSAGSNLPVVAGPLLHTEELAAGAIEAQLYAQEYPKRGLRGGQPVLNQARSAYLGAEWSGSNDRRPKRGLFTKTDI